MPSFMQTGQMAQESLGTRKGDVIKPSFLKKKEMLAINGIGDILIINAYHILT